MHINTGAEMKFIKTAMKTSYNQNLMQCHKLTQIIVSVVILQVPKRCLLKMSALWSNVP